MKKTIAIFILTLFLFVTGRHILFRTYVSSQKSSFRKALLKTDKADCLRLVVAYQELYKDRPGFEWKENNKELVIDGKFHEVLSVQIQAGIAVIYVIPDEEENKLLAGYLKTNDQAGQPFTRLLHFMLSMVFLEPNMDPLTAYCIQKENLFSTELDFSIHSFHSEIPKPPQV